MMKLFAPLAVLGILLLASCGKDVGNSTGGENGPSGPGAPTPGNTYTYELTDPVAGCSTGKHIFRSKQNLCVGLQDEGANHSCALQQRKDYFEAQNCDGRFGTMAKLMTYVRVE